LLHFDAQLSPSSGGGESSSKHFSWHVESSAMHALLHAAPVPIGFGVVAGGGADDFEVHASASTAGAIIRRSTGTET
jgi:hypothetical protein